MKNLNEFSLFSNNDTTWKMSPFIRLAVVCPDSNKVYYKHTVYKQFSFTNITNVLPSLNDYLMYVKLTFIYFK